MAIACLLLLQPLHATAEEAQAPAKKPSPWSLCAKATNLIERQEGIPRQLLRAISKVESGRFHQKKQVVMAWPWTVMAEGRGRYLPTKAAAIAEVEGLKARGVRNIDVGCMQVNLHYHPHAFADLNQAFDPIANVAYAASFLRSLRVQEGSWAKAVARYHSADPGRYKQYRVKVHVAWRQERAKYLEALSELQAQQFAALEPLPAIMTWHQATVAEPFHRQFETLSFAAAPFESQTWTPPVGPESILALAYEAPAPVSISAREPDSHWPVRVSIAAREPADLELSRMTAAIAAREPPESTASPAYAVSIAAREPAEFIRSPQQAVSIAAREPLDLHRPEAPRVTIAAREPADPSARSSSAVLQSIFGDAYPGFARAAPIQPGEQWGLVWPLLEPHAERVGRSFIGFLQSLPTESGGNG